MTATTIEVWITKYALSSGIFSCCGVKNPDTGGVSLRRGNGFLEHYYGKDWHETEEAALYRANVMRQAKIKALRKQIAKLEAMDFSVKSEKAS